MSCHILQVLKESAMIHTTEILLGNRRSYLFRSMQPVRKARNMIPTEFYHIFALRGGPLEIAEQGVAISKNKICKASSPKNNPTKPET